MMEGQMASQSGDDDRPEASCKIGTFRFFGHTRSQHSRRGGLMAFCPQDLRDRGLRDAPLSGELALGHRLLLYPGLPDPVCEGRRDFQRPPTPPDTRGAQIHRLRGPGTLLLTVQGTTARRQPTPQSDVVATPGAPAMMQDPCNAMHVRFLVTEERPHDCTIALRRGGPPPGPATVRTGMRVGAAVHLAPEGCGGLEGSGHPETSQVTARRGCLPGAGPAPGTHTTPRR
jgi:hypothetical protein